jgi:hypothetical protein
MYHECILEELNSTANLSSVGNCCCLTATPSVAGRRPSRRTRPGRPASEKAPANTRTRAPSKLPASRGCIHCVVRPCLESLPLYLRNKEFVYEGEDTFGKSGNPKLKNERRSTRPGNSWNRINSVGLLLPPPPKSAGCRRRCR